MLARKARVGGEAAASGVVTPARALRLAFARAVERVAGAQVAVVAVSEAALVLDEVVARLGTDDLVLALAGAEGVSGLAALDPELRSALVECQTTGAVSPEPAPERPVSVADAALTRPVVDAFLEELLAAAAPTALAGWGEGVATAGRLDGARGAGLSLAEAGYRLVALTVDLGAGTREGRLLVALPAREAPAPTASDWSGQFARAVQAAPAELRAVLHRFELPLERAEALAPGQVLPLEGVTVASVRLEGAERALVGHARLGQSAGLKAIRLGPPPRPELTERSPALPPAGADDRTQPEAGAEAWPQVGEGPGEDPWPAPGAAEQWQEPGPAPAQTEAEAEQWAQEAASWPTDGPEAQPHWDEDPGARAYAPTGEEGEGMP
ncbi:possible flagellar switch protein FliM [Oceanicola granulosus HTCC2516]|uniref:Possible flagellar switch protein FliM n=1 Tax=Oceanicola granulosus (strain ATCC BAA-861 / DSM 15982 / KCTC 12143 / HTCC2516) TaxID=314256 RepID=Q2CBY5_OCEGH|nr:possible flagellar switch protein FliM [Oceanicola granulosus HTCC2516]